MLDPREEAKFDELKGMFRDLKLPPPPEIFIGLQVHKDGELIFDDKQRGHSWTRNFYNYKCLIGTNAGYTNVNFGTGYLSGKNNEGSVISYLRNIEALTTGSVATTYGIVVGTSDTAFNVEQYALGALIAHGTGAGQLTYQASGFNSKAYALKVWTATSKRIFNNNSGGDITVKEIGLYSAYYSLAYLTERSVLSPTVLVPDGAQLTATYEISMDFSSID